jgi:hypothetical protein
MKPLFIVGAKLLGIYLIINGMIELFALANRGGGFPYAAQLAVSCLIQLIAGTALVFFTEIVATAVRIRDFGDQPPNVSMRQALEVGIILLGLIQLLSILPRIVVLLSEYLTQARIQSGANLLGLDALALAACLLMIVFARKIAAVLYRANGHQSDP